jgi:hypothetical protein
MLKRTAMFVTSEPAGIPETETVLVVPTGVLSGIANGNPAEAAQTPVVGADTEFVMLRA